MRKAYTIHISYPKTMLQGFEESVRTIVVPMGGKQCTEFPPPIKHSHVQHRAARKYQPLPSTQNSPETVAYHMAQA